MSLRHLNQVSTSVVKDCYSFISHTFMHLKLNPLLNDNILYNPNQPNLLKLNATKPQILVAPKSNTSQ
jgi:hypothetical protein